MNSELARYDESVGALTQWRDPEQVLAEATKAAAALGRVIALKNKPVVFNGETYLELEDWQTVGKFYGITTKVLETRYVDYGGVTGWEAVAVALNADGMEVSRAESMCMTDEDNWGSVPEYAWKDVLDEHGKKIWDANLRNGKGGYKATKELVGSKPKPMFQLRSMAQTRACGKAFRQVLSWVVVLGGFKPNVAEEMIESQLGGEQQKEERKPVQQPQRASDKAKQAEQPAGTPKPQDDTLEVISGVIESLKRGTKENSSVWIKFTGHFVALAPTMVPEGMDEGYYIKVKARKFNDASFGEYFKVAEVLECSVVQEGQAEESPTTTAATPETAAGEATTESFDKPAEPLPEEGTVTNPDNPLKGLFDSGAVKKGSDVPSPEPKKEGTIGIKKAQRIHALITSNHKRTGFTEDVLKGLMAQMELTHLRDLPEVMHVAVEAYALGDMDWRTGKPNGK